MAKKTPVEEYEMIDFFPENELPIIGEKMMDIEVDVYHKNKIKNVKLSSLAKNKWLVLFFYPADFTFVCPTELEDVADHYKELKKMGVEVASVSTDTAFVHKAWHDQSPSIQKIDYPMVADPTGMLSRMHGVYIENEGVALRGTFIYNKQGELAAYEVNNNDIGRNAAELVRKIQAAQFVATHNGMVCPAKWTPGEETLKPGVDLVGKI